LDLPWYKNSLLKAIRKTIRKKVVNILLWRNPCADHIFFTFEEGVRVTPSFLQRGKQPAGSIPLTLLSISPVSEGNFSSSGAAAFF
jgi:hypothetical protein